MSSPEGPLLDRERIRALFLALAQRLQARGVVGDIYVIGGAAMAMAYDARRSTRDIDAVFVPHGIVHDESVALAEELGLPRWWLNDQASVYVAQDGDPDRSMTFDHPGLRVSAASPGHLLAMKAIAGRRRDLDDLRTLVGLLQLASVEQVVEVCGRVFPEERLTERARLMLSEVFAPGGGAQDLQA